MHKFMLNQFELKIAIRPRSAVLIKSGTEEGVDPTLPNMNFIRTQHPETGVPETGVTTVFLPGSSLKGVIRSHAERIIRTLLGEDRCCDPLSKSACGERPEFKTPVRRESQIDGAHIYQNLCAACQMFGHTVMASRFTVADAFPAEAIESLPVRQMVAIDRRSGGSVNTFTMETLTEGIFTTRIVMRNFESWQLGLLALVLRDLAIGRLRIGFGKSRGLGLVSLDLIGMRLSYPLGTVAPALDQYVYGVGELLQSKDTSSAKKMLADYGFFAVPIGGPSHFNETAQTQTDWAQTEVVLDDSAAIGEVLQAQVNAWRAYVEQSQ